MQAGLFLHHSGDNTGEQKHGKSRRGTKANSTHSAKISGKTFFITMTKMSLPEIKQRLCGASSLGEIQDCRTLTSVREKNSKAPGFSVTKSLYSNADGNQGRARGCFGGVFAKKGGVNG